MPKIRKRALTHQKFVYIPISDYLGATQVVPRHRLCSCIRALCQAAILDHWDAQKGVYDYEAGDALWTPQNIYEQRLWSAARAEQHRKHQQYGDGRVQTYKIP